MPFALTLAVLGLCLSPPLQAACPPGNSNPVTSGDPAADSIVVLGGLGPAPVGSFFLAGSGAQNNSGALPSSAWLSRAGDVDGDGLPEIRVDAPGEGPGGWGDPLVMGCPTSVSPPHPPLILFVRHAREDLDGDGHFDVFEDFNRNGHLDPGEDIDGDGRLTPLPVGGVGGGCEGILREDLDCDGRLDKINEDFNGNGRLDPGEDLDRDRHLDNINEDRNNDDLLDDTYFAEGANNPYIVDENGDVGNFYPYGATRPSPGGFVIVAINWDGQAYNLQAMNLATSVEIVGEDLDGDGAFDVFEDRNHNGILDAGEDVDGDGRLTPPDGCEGATREDKDCDGRLDTIDEDLNHNGQLDPGEDLDQDLHLDDGTEDRNLDYLLNDRPFPSPTDVIYCYDPQCGPGTLPPTYPYGSFTPAPAQQVRVLAALPLPSAPPAGVCPAMGGAGQPAVHIASINSLSSGALDARVSISDPDSNPLSGRVTIGARIEIPDLAYGDSDLCNGPLLPDGAPGQGALFVGSVGLPPFLIDLDSITGCDDGRPDVTFTYGTCDEAPGKPAQAVLTLSCPEPFPICVTRTDGGAAFEYVVHQVDPTAAVLFGTTPALPSVSYDGSLLPRRIDLKGLPAPGVYALTITASDGTTPTATDSMPFTWNGEPRLYINHPGNKAGGATALHPEPVPMPDPVPVE
jgi:hypothetical protein